MENAEDIRLARFLEQVKALKLRFPVADISAKTGYDKGNVSSFIKGKKPLSDNFLSKFEKAYNIKEVAGTSLQPPVLESLLIRLMEQQVQAAERANQLMELQNRLIKDTVDPVKEKINNIDAKTENLWNGLTAHVIRQGSGQEILFDSLEHLRGLAKGDLKRELDSKVSDLLRGSGSQGKDHSMDTRDSSK